MNKQLLLIGIICISSIYSCKNSKEKNITTQISFVDTIPFYPYNAEINKEADSLISKKKSLVMTVTDSSGKNKITIITADEFKTLVQIFTDKDITRMPLKQFYKESIFNDMTTVSTVMNYTTKKDSLPIKNIDVLLNAKAGGEIKRLDMKLIFNKADSAITENYSWVFGKEFYVLRYAETSNGKGISTKLNVSWKK
jgi:hypothetical protein